ncbi:MAG: roadblock/LC7 domain-containing protein [Deltaproteobacteria bacterium]|nr:MAG: roadblock/LC7 domain-containing protein [Deltaproteobacteria bacterium]
MASDKPTASERFAARMAAIDGVKNFVLIRKDGQVITHNLEDPDELAALATLCGLQSEAIAGTLGFSQVERLCLRRAGGESLSLFRLDKYFVAVIQEPDCPLDDLLDRVSKFLSSLRRQNKSTA